MPRAAAREAALPRTVMPHAAVRAFAGNPKQKGKGEGKVSKKKQQKEDAREAQKFYEVFARALDSHGKKHSVRSEEQQAKDFEIVKAYKRGLSRRHNKDMRELRRLLDLKWAAVEKLPTDLDRQQALEVPFKPFPPARGRFPLATTPPIPNFAELKSRGKIVFD